MLNTTKETVNHLMDTFFPGSKETSEVSSPRHNKLPDHEIEQVIFTEQKVAAAFKTFGKQKATGPDQVRPIMMQHFGPKAIKAVIQMYRASISLRYVPTLWRHAKVVFIPKGGKTDSSEAKAYRL